MRDSAGSSVQLEPVSEETPREVRFILDLFLLVGGKKLILFDSWDSFRRSTPFFPPEKPFFPPEKPFFPPEKPFFPSEKPFFPPGKPKNLRSTKKRQKKNENSEKGANSREFFFLENGTGPALNLKRLNRVFFRRFNVDQRKIRRFNVDQTTRPNFLILKRPQRFRAFVQH